MNRPYDLTGETSNAHNHVTPRQVKGNGYSYVRIYLPSPSLPDPTGYIFSARVYEFRLIV